MKAKSVNSKINVNESYLISTTPFSEFNFEILTVTKITPKMIRFDKDVYFEARDPHYCGTGHAKMYVIYECSPEEMQVMINRRAERNLAQLKEAADKQAEREARQVAVRNERKAAFEARRDSYDSRVIVPTALGEMNVWSTTNAYGTPSVYVYYVSTEVNRWDGNTQFVVRLASRESVDGSFGSHSEMTGATVEEALYRLF